VEHLAEDMAERWRKGERPLVEEYLALHPELWNLPDAALELISEEIYLRQESGQEPSGADWVRRFPQWDRPLQALLQCHQLLGAPLSAPRFPREGEILGEFRLAAELGRGAYAHVFLATQPALADRPVVLKLTPRAGREHVSLARLQHTHIVPLYSVHEFPERGLRGLCLPYFGGVTLARLLESLRDRPPRQRTGRDIVSVLQRAPTAGIAAGPARRFLSRACYIEAVCWIGASLADALQYAQERGLVHLDIKPANVLLAADGQPMLLDFHLAHAPLAAGDSIPGWLGGTPGYMAPEQEAALAAVRTGRPIPVAVDGRADIYALGLVLHELLCSALPESRQMPVQSERVIPKCQRGFSRRLRAGLRQRNPEVAAGLVHLVAKCLAPDPKDRYAGAAVLSADLRRHLANLPLRDVPDRSPVERWKKWQRRHPYGLVSWSLLLVLFLGGGLLLAQSSRQAKDARNALQEGQQHLQQARYTEAFETLKYGAAMTEALPFHAGLRKKLRDGMQMAERGKAAGELHLFCERIRPLYGAVDLPLAQAQAVDNRCEELWQKRDLIVRSFGGSGAFSQLDPQVRIDLLDLAIVWAILRAHMAPGGDAHVDCQTSLEILAAAEAILGPSCVLYQERSKRARELGLTDVAQAAERQASLLCPRTAWEHYALGRADFLGGEVRKAAQHMERALELEPHALWPNFYKGCCAHRLGQYADAVTAFSICVVLAPQSGWCFHNRGLAYMELGRPDQALHDFDHALCLDPALAAAALSRGTLHYRQGHYDEALPDLQRALDQGADGTAVYYSQALVHLARQDREAAQASLKKALQHDPHHRQAKELLARLQQTD
jgi:serine/threonine protein kinase/Tfp pilus assembly protein PilF